MKVFIGWDSKEPIAFSVLAHSILTRASRPVEIVPLARMNLEKLYTRPRQTNEATEFSLTRFLVPYLSDYKGYSLFVDCDMLCQADINDLMLYAMADPGKAVYVAKHDYVPKSATKFDGHEQTSYPCKNWSSVMLFDNARCAALTPDYVNTATGLAMHRFKWTTEDSVGELPLEWNWLVGEYAPKHDAKLLHYTLGTPAFSGYECCDHSDLWWSEYNSMHSPLSLDAALVGTGMRRCTVCNQKAISDRDMWLSGVCAGCRSVKETV